MPTGAPPPPPLYTVTSLRWQQQTGGLQRSGRSKVMIGPACGALHITCTPAPQLTRAQGANGGTEPVRTMGIVKEREEPQHWRSQQSDCSPP